MYTAGAQHSSSRLSLWRPAPQEKLLLCVNVAAPEKRSRPAHGWTGRPRSWQRSARWYQAFFFFLLVPGARWYPTLKPRQFFHTKTKINRTSGQTHKRSVFFFLHVAIRNSLRSNYEQATKWYDNVWSKTLALPRRWSLLSFFLANVLCLHISKMLK